MLTRIFALLAAVAVLWFAESGLRAQQPGKIVDTPLPKDAPPKATSGKTLQWSMKVVSPPDHRLVAVADEPIHIVVRPEVHAVGWQKLEAFHIAVTVNRRVGKELEPIVYYESTAGGFVVEPGSAPGAQGVDVITIPGLPAGNYLIYAALHNPEEKGDGARPFVALAEKDLGRAASIRAIRVEVR